MANPSLASDVEALHASLASPSADGADALARLRALRTRDAVAFDHALGQKLAPPTPVSDARSAGTAPPAAEKLDFPVECGVTWHTHECVRTLKPRWYCVPDSLADLKALVRTAVAKGRKVRAFGTGHSYSDVALCEDYFVDTSKLQAELKFPHFRADVDTSELVHVQAGMKLRNLNALLDSQGRAMINLGGFTGQSVIGAISTGTHGSGLDIGPFASLVVSLVIVTEKETLRIEGDNGPTDPHTWNEGGVDRLVQSDKVLNAVTVGLGGFGLIYSLVLKVRKAYLLEERRLLTKWSVVGPALKSGAAFTNPKTGKPHRHLEVLVNPHPNKGDHTVLVTQRNEVKSAPKGSATSRDFVSQLLTNSKLIQGSVIGVMNAFPHLIPGFFDSTMESWQVDSFVSKSFTVLSSDTPPNGFACENAVKMDGDRHVRGMEAIFAYAAKEVKANRRYLSMTAMRFVKAAPAHLSAAYDADGIPSCYYEVITPSGLAGATELFKGVSLDLMKLGSRPHWGLEFDVVHGRDQVRKMYPRLDDWMEVRRSFAPKGTFDNAFTDRIGVSM